MTVILGHLYFWWVNH